MAITTGTVNEFGTEDEVISTGAAVANNAYSLAAHATSHTNDDNAREGSFKFNGTAAANPSANTAYELYARKMDIEGASTDANEPSDTYREEFIGAFSADSSTTSQVLSFDVEDGDIPAYENDQLTDYYIRNSSGQSLNSGATVDFTPKAAAPAP